MGRGSEPLRTGLRVGNKTNNTVTADPWSRCCNSRGMLPVWGTMAAVMIAQGHPPVFQGELDNLFAVQAAKDLHMSPLKGEIICIL